MVKNALALRKSYGRLAPFAAFASLRSRFARAVSMGTPRFLTREVSVHGPRTAHRHLADHVRQHLFFYREDLVAAHGRLRGRRGHRPSFPHHLFADGPRLCSPA